MGCRRQGGSRRDSLSDKFDAVSMLDHSHARHINSTCITEGIGLAAWSNQTGSVRYRAPHHHTLSYYTAGSDHLRRVHSSRHGSGQGMFSLLPAGHHSQWALSGNLRFVHVYLDPDYLDSFAASVMERDGVSIQLPEVVFAEDPYLDQLIRFVLCMLDWHDNADGIALSRVADLIMLQLIKFHDSYRAYAPTLHYSLAPAVERRVKDYIESNLDQPLTIPELAGVAGLSDYHLARMFKQSTGFTLHAYVTTRRIACARSLLNNSTLSIADIAGQCGFSSQSHFPIDSKCSQVSRQTNIESPERNCHCTSGH